MSMSELLLAASTAAATLAAALALLCLVRLRQRQDVLTREAAGAILRGETEILRRAGEEQARGLRQEIGASLKNFQETTVTSFDALRNTIDDQVRAFGERLDGGVKAIDARAAAIAEKLNADLTTMRAEAGANREGLRQVIERKLDDSVNRQAETAKDLREELGAGFRRLGAGVAEALNQASEQQKERLGETAQAINRFGEKHEKSAESLRQAVEARLDALRTENAAKLDEMRQTVDEKLQTTLETRLGESFTRVVEHLERVHKGIGEMQTLAANVGDLKSVLTNVKVRGTYGEMQLALLLEQFLSPEQYIHNACVRPGSAERVEFAIKFPGDGETTLLAIDSKFPREDFDHLQEAQAAGDVKLTGHFRAQLESKIKACARDICGKYINPPHTLDFAILFVPTESLYAEVLRQPGFCDQLQRDYRVMLAGPTNLAALLTSFQMGFRSLALQKRSSEVWQVLGAVRNEFGKYNSVVDRLAKQLGTAVKSVDALNTRTRVMARTLTKVETLTDDTAAQRLLGLAADEVTLAADEPEGALPGLLPSEIVFDEEAA
jgi:DNA recombination protein RmuC